MPALSVASIPKLATKVERQGLIEADCTKLEERMQFTRENYRTMREALLKVVYAGARAFEMYAIKEAKPIVRPKNEASARQLSGELPLR